ncbi:MAG: hypothetical protein HC927_01260 [Deltaproteobacteria bacterium]|nr:hypothetical protein [Deltaproteobacteria bacterium]
MDDASSSLTGARDAALSSYVDAANMASGAVNDAQGQLRTDLTSGQASGNAALTVGMRNAANAVNQGLEQGRSDIAGGLSGAESALERLQQLQGYEQGATNAIGAYDVTGARSRLGEIYDQGVKMEMDPGYQFRQQQGEQAINRMASADRCRISGRTLQELNQFNSNLASQEYSNAFNRQVGLAGAADASQNQLLLNQAGRSDNAAMQAQQNQMSLAQMGFNAQNTMAGMRFGAGQAMGNMAYGAGNTLGGFQMQAPA